MNKRLRHAGRQAGFTLIESLVSILILTIFMVAIFTQINKAQSYYRVEDKKVDLTTQQRDFVDQFTRDLHQAGYPTQASLGNGAGFSGLTANTNFVNTVEMTGDLGDGNGVSTVTYTYDPTTQTLQRAVNGLATIAVQNVSSATFTGYDINGNTISGTMTPAVLAQVRSIRITFSTQSGLDAAKMPLGFTSTGMARLPNNN